MDRERFNLTQISRNDNLGLASIHIGSADVGLCAHVSPVHIAADIGRVILIIIQVYMCGSVDVTACMHVCVCVYACMHAYVWMDGCVDVCMHVCMCVHVYMCVHAWMCGCMCMYTCVCVHACMYMYTICMYVCMHVHVNYVSVHACIRATYLYGSPGPTYPLMGSKSIAEGLWILSLKIFVRRSWPLLLPIIPICPSLVAV